MKIRNHLAAKIAIENRFVLMLAATAFIALGTLSFAPADAAADNTTPGKFSRSINIPNNSRAGRIANNEDFQTIINHKNRQQRGDNAHNRRNARNNQQSLNDEERTQSEDKLAAVNDRSGRNQTRARNNSGRRGQTPKVNGSSAGMND